MQAKKKAPKKVITESKERIIARLVAKAELDFKCCGHGHLKGSAN